MLATSTYKRYQKDFTSTWFDQAFASATKKTFQALYFSSAQERLKQAAGAAISEVVLPAACIFLSAHTKKIASSWASLFQVAAGATSAPRRYFWKHP